MNKKTTIILSIILVVLVLGSLAFYQYSVSNTNSNLKEENNSGNHADIEPINPDSNQNSNPIQIDDIKVNGSDNSDNTGPQGGLIVCVDKCGDGACQSQKDDTCDPKGLNCVCQETVLECPQDCK